MTPFTLHLQDISQYRRIDDVVSFVGQDATGEFGVMARHGRMMTALSWGLARFRTANGVWHYVVLPSGLLYVVDGAVYLATRRFHLDDNLERIMGEFEAQLRAEEQELEALKKQIHQLEREMLKRLWRMELSEVAP